MITVNFWGVRGSHPVPGNGTLRFGGNTACVEVRAKGFTLILDAGTGLIPLGQELARHAKAAASPIEATLLLSHFHHDHTQGFPFFSPAYLPSTRLHVLGPGSFGATTEDVLSGIMAPPTFPVSLKELAASIDFHDLADTDVITLGAASGGMKIHKTTETIADPEAVQVSILRSYAHPGGALVYKVKWGGRSIVYATDVEGYVESDRRLAAFARGADVLIHDAQYSAEHYCGQVPGFPCTQGFGHSTPEMACQVARTAGVKQLILFHHDPSYDDIAVSRLEDGARLLFANTIAAYEGLEIQLERLPVVDKPQPRPGFPTGSRRPRPSTRT